MMPPQWPASPHCPSNEQLIHYTLICCALPLSVSVINLRDHNIFLMLCIREVQHRGSPAYAAQPEEQLLLYALVRHHLLHPSPHPCRLLRLLLLRQAAGRRWLQRALCQGRPADWACVIARYPPAHTPAHSTA